MKDKLINCAICVKYDDGEEKAVLNRYNKLGKNVALITLGNFGSKILTFIMLPLYTAVLTTSEYGTADLIMTTVSLISPFFTLLISEAVMRFALDKERDKNQVLSIGIVIVAAGFALLLILSPFLLLIKGIRPYYVYFIAYYLVVVLHTLVSQFVKGIEKVGIYSLSGVIHTACFVSLNILFLLILKIGITGYLLALILSNAVTILYLWIGADLHKYIIYPRMLNKDLLKDMLIYSIPMIPNSVSWWVSNSSDKYIITMFCGVGLTGIYSVAQKIPSFFSAIYNIFISAWQISAVEDFGSEETRTFYAGIYTIYSSINILSVSALICGSRLIGGLLFSKEFHSGWKYVPILLLAVLFHAMSAFLGSIYTSARQTRMLFVSTVIAATANVVLNFLLIPGWGAQGAALATFFSYFLVWIVRLINSRTILELKLNIAKDVLCYITIIIQIYLVLLDEKLPFCLALGLYLFLCFVNREFILTLVQKLYKIVKNLCKRINN